MNVTAYIVRFRKDGITFTHGVHTDLRSAQGASKELVRDRVADTAWVVTVTVPAEAWRGGE